MKTKICTGCGEEFTPRRADRRTCSDRCRAAIRERGLGKHGLTFSKALGRWVIAGRDGSLTYYYRAVMAAHLGRELSPDELVHHVNEDPTDDRIENLEITTRADHARHHAAMRRAA